jgi:hypothetical protein
MPTWVLSENVLRERFVLMCMGHTCVLNCVIQRTLDLYVRSFFKRSAAAVAAVSYRVVLPGVAIRCGAPAQEQQQPHTSATATSSHLTLTTADGVKVCAHTALVVYTL